MEKKKLKPELKQYKESTRKLEMCTVNMSNQRFKLRQYNAFVKPEVLNGSEMLLLFELKMVLEDLEKKDRKILCVIMNEDGELVLRSNKELYNYCPEIMNEIRMRRRTLERNKEDSNFLQTRKADR